MNDQRCRKCTVPFCKAPGFKSYECLITRDRAGLGKPVTNLEHINDMNRQQMAKEIVFFLETVAGGFQPSLDEQAWVLFLADMYVENSQIPEDKPERNWKTVVLDTVRAGLRWVMELFED